MNSYDAMVEVVTPTEMKLRSLFFECCDEGRKRWGTRETRNWTKVQTAISGELHWLC